MRSGVGLIAAATAAGCCHVSLRSAAVESGLEIRPVGRPSNPEARSNRAARMWLAGGCSMSEAGASVGISSASVFRAVKRLRDASKTIAPVDEQG